jgi:hypothetical protein
MGRFRPGLQIAAFVDLLLMGARPETSASVLEKKAMKFVPIT